MPNKKHQFTINEDLLPLCEVGFAVSPSSLGIAGPTRMQVQRWYDQERVSAATIRQAVRATEKALNIWNLQVNTAGDTVVHYVDEQAPLQGTAPRGFVSYRDGMYHGFVRKSDGAGLRDLHDTGECPSDCVYCKGDSKQATQTADRAGEKAKATSQHWKSGR